MKYNIERLGKYIEVLSGYAFKSIDFTASGIPVVKIKNINSPDVLLDDVSYVSPNFLKTHSKYILNKNDILVAMTGSHINQWTSVVGRIARVKYDEKSLLNQRVGKIIVTDIEHCDENFVYYYLSQDSVKIQLANIAGGAANQANISPDDIKRLQILFPDVNIQRRIGKILVSYDDIIENNQKQIKLLEEAVQRLYKEWFVELRFPCFEKCKIVDGMPKGWKKVGLEKVAPILTGKKDANFGTDDGKYLFFTCAQEPIKAPSYSFDCDAVILAGNGDFNVKLYRGQFEAYQRTYVFSPSDEDNLFLLYHAVRENMRQLFQGASGSTIKFLTKKMLEEINIYIPTEDVKWKFNIYCENCQQKLELLKREIQLAKEARDRLLSKLMNNEIEITRGIKE